jgi:1,4-alpha-glucan branching enzyme
MVMKSQLFGGKTRVTFSLPAGDLPPAVSVVGDFNGWQPGQHELKPRRNGTRSVSVALMPGSYRFRYLATGGLWLDEQSARRLGHDCLLEV